MASLIAKSPLEGLLPLAHGGVRLEAVAPEAITSIMPFAGQEEALGLPFPAPNRSVEQGGLRLLWSGAGQALAIGALPRGLDGKAALSDQSDAWAVMQLSGEGAEAVLARLTPVDLNPAVFQPGHVLRSEVAHMNAVLARLAADRFEIMVFRSMAVWAVHEVEAAMRAVAARGALA